MNLEENILWLESLPRFKEKVNLDKIRHGASLLGNPQNSYKTVHITGTNGKGSTAHFLSSILAKSAKVGLFTSPYIIKFNERIQINNEMIPDDKLFDLINRMRVFYQNYLETYNETFTFFELLTLMTYLYFKEEQVDYAIIEVGIGGRLDSTNIITPVLSIITSVSIDHEKQLGSTLEGILENKLGIVKKEVPLITAVKGFNQMINQYCDNLNAPVYYLVDEDMKLLSSYPLKFKFEHHTYTPSMQGLYQMKNASLAIMAANYLEPKLPIHKVKEGIMEAVNPGRFEILNDNPLIILDGAHNIEGQLVLKESIKRLFKEKKVHVLFACMSDKPYMKMLEILSSYTKSITLSNLPYHRALATETLSGYKSIKDPYEAFKYVYELLDEDSIMLITGSLYFVSYIRSYL